MEHRNAQAGMTLLELLVVLALIALITTSISVLVIHRYREAQVDTARVQVKKLSNEVQQFMVSREGCPTLDDLVTARFIPAPPRDPWGTVLAMHCPGEHDPAGVDVRSFGPDKAEGTPDDVLSWHR